MDAGRGMASGRWTTSTGPETAREEKVAAGSWDHGGDDGVDGFDGFGGFDGDDEDDQDGSGKQGAAHLCDWEGWEESRLG